MKKRILFVYSTMMLGGSTTSLLSLLYGFDYNKYQVDLLLYKTEGPLIQYIPEQVNVLPPALDPKMTRLKRRIRSVANGKLALSVCCGIRYYRKVMMAQQVNAYMRATWCRIPEQSYDVAIGFMELWPDVFVNKYIKAEKKISWIHTDYEKTQFIPALDSHTFDESDYIVNVSEKGTDNFKRLFPQYADKCVYVENILTREFLRYRMQYAPATRRNIESIGLKLLSVCRIDNDSKALDRAAEAIRTIIERGHRIIWYIVGSGPDEKKLRECIDLLNLSEHVHMLGAIECPFSLYDKFDAFFLPSRREGKPMAVTEAQMLGLPPIVTEYTSAREQITDGKTGLITDNSKEGIVDILSRVIAAPKILETVRKNLRLSDFDNREAVNEIYKLMES